jgi:hypothetical protein
LRQNITAKNPLVAKLRDNLKRVIRQAGRACCVAQFIYTGAVCAGPCSFPDSCATLAVMSWGAEAKLYNFVQWAIQKLEADTPELTDEDEEDNYQV